MSLLFRCTRIRPSLFNNGLRCIGPSSLIRVSSTSPPKPAKEEPKFVVNFKQTDVRKVFKEFYSFYGPVFVGCHIGISLLSLGFFCSLVYFAIDPVKYMPEFMVEKLGERMSSLTGDGGKFVVAYAIHKVILPLRLGSAIYLTRVLSSRFRIGKK